MYIVIFNHLFHVLPFFTIQPLLTAIGNTMFSQSLFAQLMRMAVLLIITLYAVRQYQPLIDSLAKHATSGGCHQHHSPKNEQHPLKHEHMEHH